MMSVSEKKRTLAARHSQTQATSATKVGGTFQCIPAAPEHLLFLFFADAGFPTTAVQATSGKASSGKMHTTHHPPQLMLRDVLVLLEP